MKLYGYKDIRKVHWEPTQKCNASCPMCDRNDNGGPVNKYLTNADMSLADAKTIFTPEFVGQLQSISACGNHGDPGLCKDLIPIFRYFKSHNPNIFLSVVTNGSMRPPRWWEELAGVADKVTFSVDGLEDTNHLYRQGVVWDRLEKNMEAFSEAGGRGTWTFIVFKYNEHQVKSAEIYAKLLGFDFVLKKSGRYINTQSLERKSVQGNLEQPDNPEYRNKELSKLDSFVEQMKSGVEIDCKAIPKKEIYISAEGFVFPCCWLGSQPYKFWRPDVGGDVWDAIGSWHNVNAKELSIKEIVEGDFFRKVEDSWPENKIKTCALKCNKGFDPFLAQWK